MTQGHLENVSVSRESLTRKVKHHHQQIKESRSKELSVIDWRAAKLIKVSCLFMRIKNRELERKLDESVESNKKLLEQLGVKSNKLYSLNCEMSSMRSVIKEKDAGYKEVYEKYRRLKELLGNTDPDTLRLILLKLKKCEKLIAKQGECEAVIYNSEESSEEIKRLNMMIREFEGSLSKVKVSYEQEVKKRERLQQEIVRLEKEVAVVTTKSLKFEYESKWQEVRQNALLLIQEELQRKVASLQEHANNMRTKYESTYKKKESKKNKYKEHIENEEETIPEKDKSENILPEKDPSPEEQMKKREIIAELEVEKSTLEENLRQEKEKSDSLEKAVNCLKSEIKKLEDEKMEAEERLSHREKRLEDLKAKFEELSSAHKKVISSRLIEGRKINKKIEVLNQQLDDLGARFVKRIEKEKMPTLEELVSQRELDESGDTSSSSEIRSSSGEKMKSVSSHSMDGSPLKKLEEEDGGGGDKKKLINKRNSAENIEIELNPKSKSRESECKSEKSWLEENIDDSEDLFGGFKNENYADKNKNSRNLLLDARKAYNQRKRPNIAVWK